MIAWTLTGACRSLSMSSFLFLQIDGLESSLNTCSTRSATGRLELYAQVGEVRSRRDGRRVASEKTIVCLGSSGGCWIDRWCRDKVLNVRSRKRGRHLGRPVLREDALNLVE
ncbi:hypothetical protein BD626DRAFT_516441 [Schizophyllum amplum]|uniref:Secreted protein n=1 Tax=Schizophyllum amplum TaxID=97359 RepID=A0A550BX40_9AGAR|nr:hypothetical protein BD626DRAFT_516441 [Auriculariopsis ampla]